MLAKNKPNNKYYISSYVLVSIFKMLNMRSWEVSQFGKCISLTLISTTLVFLHIKLQIIVETNQHKSGPATIELIATLFKSKLYTNDRVKPAGISSTTRSPSCNIIILRSDHRELKCQTPSLQQFDLFNLVRSQYFTWNYI